MFLLSTGVPLASPPPSPGSLSDAQQAVDKWEILHLICPLPAIPLPSFIQKVLIAQDTAKPV